MHIDVWCVGWLTFGIIFVILALFYYLIDIWFYEDIIDNENSEIIIFNEENTDICMIYVFDTESFVIEDIE